MLLIAVSVMCQLAAALPLKKQALLGAGYGALFTAVSVTAYNLRVLEVTSWLR